MCEFNNFLAFGLKSKIMNGKLCNTEMGIMGYNTPLPSDYSVVRVRISYTVSSEDSNILYIILFSFIYLF